MFLTTKLMSFGMRYNPSSMKHCRLKVSSSSSHVQLIFDRNAKHIQRKRAALNATKKNNQKVDTYDYIKNEVGWRIADRVFDIKRTFTVGLEVAADRGHVSRHLDDDAVDYLFLADPISELLKQRTISKELSKDHQDIIVADDNVTTFLRDSSLDLVVSCLSMHWINDLNTAFRDIFRILRPDGAFIGAMFCSDTLFELRSALQEAEMQLRKSYTARVSPFVRPEDVAALLNRAGYNLVTIDCDEFRVGYPSAIELMRDLHGMGEQNCSIGRQLNFTRPIMDKTCQIYRDMYSESSDGSVPATFQIVYWIGWHPDPSQAEPSKRGSATFSLKDINKLVDDELPVRPV